MVFEILTFDFYLEEKKETENKQIYMDASTSK